jgi:hypothetical protein
MTPIELNKATPELNRQLDFLIKQEFRISYFKYRHISLYLLVITILLVALLIFTDFTTLITLKAVSTVIISMLWTIAFIIGLTILFKKYKRNIWKRKTLKATFSNDIKFKFSFDDKELHFVTDSYKTDIKWNYYKYYAVDKDSIFIFNKANIYDAIYYSKNELGNKHFDDLKQICATNLILIENKKGT